MSVKAQYLDVGAPQFPIDKFYQFGNGSYLFRFRKNGIAATVFYTIEVFKPNGRDFLFSNKLVYGINFIDSLLAPFTDKIIPLNVDFLASGVGPTDLNDETLGDQILICTKLTET